MNKCHWMSNHWQFCTNVAWQLNSRLTWNAVPVCDKWAVFVGVIIWLIFYEPAEGYLVDRFCKQWNVSAERKKCMMGFGWGAGRGETSWKLQRIEKIKCNTSSGNSMGRVGVDCSGTTVSFTWGNLFLALRYVLHGVVANPYSHFPAVSRPS